MCEAKVHKVNEVVQMRLHRDQYVIGLYVAVHEPCLMQTF
jgi:hypothetical protein